MLGKTLGASLGVIFAGFLNALYPVFIRNSTLDLQFKILLRFVSFFIASFIYVYVKSRVGEKKEREKYKEHLQNVHKPEILKISTLNYLYVAGIIVAMQYAPQYITFPIFMSWTIILVLLEKYYFHAVVSNKEIIFVLLGMFGIVLMNVGEYLNTTTTASYNKIFILFAAFSALAHGVFVPFFKKVSEQTQDPIVDTYYLTGFSSILATLVVLVRHFFTKYKLKLKGMMGQIVKLVAFYIIVEGLANYAYYYGLSVLPAVNTAILYNSMVVFGLLIGVFYFKERPTPLTITGVVIILASIVMLQLEQG